MHSRQRHDLKRTPRSFHAREPRQNSMPNRLDNPVPRRQKTAKKKGLSRSPHKTRKTGIREPQKTEASMTDRAAPSLLISRNPPHQGRRELSPV